MKIKVQEKSYAEVMRLPKEKRKRPIRPGKFWRTLLKTASAPDLKATNFTYKEIGMEKLGKDEPCLILMNHSSFIDLKMCSKIFADRPFNIVCTSDGFIGKEGLMRNLGCIPTKKFVTDVALIKDMKYALENLKDSVLMYPEASYSFDGTATPLPEVVGKSIKLLQVPVVMVRTYGAFARDPLYNNLQLRKVDVSADVMYLLSPEEIREKSVDEINAILKEQFSFDNFSWQRENQIKITEPFRADYLNRVLYKCPHCNTEGQMKGQGIHIGCGKCGATYELTDLGSLQFMGVEQATVEARDEACAGGRFDHVPDWYAWERACVKEELEAGSYKLDIPVDICMLVDTKCIYKVGEGRLTHTKEGFHLVGCEGQLDFSLNPQASYSLYADYYWYELGDMICIGDQEKLFYCFPKIEGDVVAKTRLATEELYKMTCAR